MSDTKVCIPILCPISHIEGTAVRASEVETLPRSSMSDTRKPVSSLEGKFLDACEIIDFGTVIVCIKNRVDVNKCKEDKHIS